MGLFNFSKKPAAAKEQMAQAVTLAELLDKSSDMREVYKSFSVNFSALESLFAHPLADDKKRLHPNHLQSHLQGRQKSLQLLMAMQAADHGLQTEQTDAVVALGHQHEMLFQYIVDKHKTRSGADAQYALSKDLPAGGKDYQCLYSERLCRQAAKAYASLDLVDDCKAALITLEARNKVSFKDIMRMIDDNQQLATQQQTVNLAIAALQIPQDNVVKDDDSKSPHNKSFALSFFNDQMQVAILQGLAQSTDLSHNQELVAIIALHGLTETSRREGFDGSEIEAFNLLTDPAGANLLADDALDRFDPKTLKNFYETVEVGIGKGKSHVLNHVMTDAAALDNFIAQRNKARPDQPAFSRATLIAPEAKGRDVLQSRLKLAQILLATQPDAPGEFQNKTSITIANLLGDALKDTYLEPGQKKPVLDLLTTLIVAENDDQAAPKNRLAAMKNNHLNGTEAVQGTAYVGNGYAVLNNLKQSTTEAAVAMAAQVEKNLQHIAAAALSRLQLQNETLRHG